MDFKEQLQEWVMGCTGCTIPDSLDTCIPCTWKQLKAILALLDAVDEVMRIDNEAEQRLKERIENEDISEKRIDLEHLWHDAYEKMFQARNELESDGG